MRKILISSDTVTSRDDLFSLVKNALPLPDYCGNNLDALHDCFTEMHEDFGITVIKDKALYKSLGATLTEGFVAMLSDVASENPHLKLEIKDKKPRIVSFFSKLLNPGKDDDFEDPDIADEEKTRLQIVKNVVAAVICDSMETKTKIFATARGYGEFKGKWEFPGGKIEKGETPEEAIAREIREELATKIKVGDKIGTIEYDYPEFHLSMQVFWCEVVEGNLELIEAESSKWLTKDDLFSVDWLPADVTLVGEIGKQMN